MPVKILIVDGPAGSGKSCLISKMTQALLPEVKLVNVPLPFEFARPRAFETSGPLADLGTSFAMAKDFARLSMLAGLDFQNSVEIVGDELPVVYVLDRWLLSSYAYGRIRAGDRLSQDYAQRERGSFIANLMLMPKILGVYRGRHPITDGSDWYSPDILKIKFLVYLPPAEVIQARRKMALREFPYDAHQEYSQFASVAQNLEVLMDEFYDLPGSLALSQRGLITRLEEKDISDKSLDDLRMWSFQ